MTIDRKLERRVEDLDDGLDTDDEPEGTLWGRFVTGDYPEDPTERHPRINQWLDTATDEHGNVYVGIEAPEWANEVDEDNLPPEQREDVNPEAGE